MIVAADAESETARLVEEVGCGLVIPPGRPDLLARALRELHGGVHDLEEMGRRGLAYVAEAADRERRLRAATARCSTRSSPRPRSIVA